MSIAGWIQAGKQACVIVEMCTRSCGAPREGQLTLPGASQEERTPELSFKDALELSRLARGGKGIPGMCRGLLKHVAFGEPKVGQYD